MELECQKTLNNLNIFLLFISKHYDHYHGHIHNPHLQTERRHHHYKFANALQMLPIKLLSLGGFRVC